MQTIVRESGLEPTKARTILTLFEGYFRIADEYAIKAKAIVVTDGSQTAQIEAARDARLFLRDKRLAVEKARKELKEQALREGKAIDGIANILKALIIPIEDYLKTQENFVELKAQAEAEERERVFQAGEMKRLADEAEEKRLEEKRVREALDKNAAEIRRLNKERLDRLAARERERTVADRKSRLEAERIRKEGKNAVAAEKARAAAKLDKVEAETKAATELYKKERAEREAKQAKQKADAKAREDKLLEEREEQRLEAHRLAEELAALVECPECGHKFKPEGRGE